MKKKLKDKIIENIDKDRSNSEKFLRNVEEYLDNNLEKIDAIGGDAYSKIIMSVAKIIEASSKANEQAVKIFEIDRRKKPKVKETGLTAEEIENALKREHEVEL